MHFKIYYNSSPLRCYLTARLIPVVPTRPKMGFRKEYQSVSSPYTLPKDEGHVKKSAPAHGWSGFLKEWWWEVVTWLIGSAAFVAIITLLIVFRNQPLDHWKLPHIQITTTIAALAQTAMATLIVSVSSCIGQLKWVWLGRSRPLVSVQEYDDSSRGPAGSSLLLWNSLWRTKRP